MSMDQVAPHMADLSEAIKKPDSPFKPCEPFLPIFQKCAQTFGVPSILIASFALQEVCSVGRPARVLLIGSLRVIHLLLVGRVRWGLCS